MSTINTRRGSRLKVVALATLMLVTTLLSTASPASADTSADTSAERSSYSVDGKVVNLDEQVGTLAFSDCPASYSCYWTGLNGTGTLLVPSSCGTFRNLPGALNNNIESVRNRGGGTVRLFDNGAGTGTPLATIYNNGANINLPAAARNRTSSIRIDC